MNKTQLVEAVAAKTGTTKVAAKAAVEATLEAITASLTKGEGAQLLGFGNFTVKAVPARTGINPATKQKIQIPAKKVVKFKASSAVKL